MLRSRTQAKRAVAVLMEKQGEQSKTVIVGAGHAGAETATLLRQQLYAGRILLIGNEPHLPYRRPPLSKAYLAGNLAFEALAIKPQAAYDKASIELRFPANVSRIDRDGRRVIMSDGTTEPYDCLVFATGGKPRKMQIEGADSGNVLYLRTIDDVQRIRREMLAGCRLAIIGGGYIGLEVAAAAVKLGAAVTVLESASRVLVRVTAPIVSAFYERVHREAGVDILTNVQIERFLRAGDRVHALLLTDGRRIASDLVIVGIGLAPNVELAAEAGIKVADGISVDSFGRTNDPHVFAVGDCANQNNEWLGRSVRIESVPDAVEQARTVAATICGRVLPYHSVPWFWSDQYDLKLQMVGLSAGYDRVVLRGDPITRSFCAYYLLDHVIIAVDAVNCPAEFMLGKRLVAQRTMVSIDNLSDRSFPLQSLLQQSVTRQQVAAHSRS